MLINTEPEKSRYYRLPEYFYLLRINTKEELLTAINVTWWPPAQSTKLSSPFSAAPADHSAR